MLGSDLLELALGVIFVYLSTSLIASAINEMIARAVALRARTLEDGIRNLLRDAGTVSQGLDPSTADATSGDFDFATRLYQHPLIKGLSSLEGASLLAWRHPRNGHPAYIPSRQFALALLDIIAPDAIRSESAEKLRAQVAAIKNEQVRGALLPLVDAAEADIATARENIERWFNDSMERVSGWYKRKTQLILLAVGFALAVGLNVDTYSIVRTLWERPALRAAIAAAAEQLAREPARPAPDFQRDLTRLYATSLPVGWSPSAGEPQSLPSTLPDWLAKVCGLLITTFAVSMGAPFWFDVLNKVTSVRSGGAPPSSKPGQ